MALQESSCGRQGKEPNQGIFILAVAIAARQHVSDWQYICF